jgi:hypothetical protein
VLSHQYAPYKQKLNDLDTFMDAHLKELVAHEAYIQAREAGRGERMLKLSKDVKSASDELYGMGFKCR